MQQPSADTPRLAWEEVPGGRGPYMFCVHGMLSSRLQWTPNLPCLLQRVRPVVFDLWGHGESPTPEDPAAYEVDRLVGEFERVREALGAQRILLCGQSLGAGLTLRYSLMHPERVVAQVFTNSVSALSPADAFGSDAVRAERAAAIEAGGRQAIRDMPYHPSRAHRIPEPLRSALAEAADRVDPRAVARLSVVTVRRLSVRAEMAAIRCPTLLVNGLWEKPFQPLRADALREIPGCRVADLDGGHAVNIENAPAFDAAVAAFVDGILGG